MKATATAKLGLNPKLNAKEKRTIMLLVCHNRVQKSYSVGGSAKYVAPNFDHLNKKHTGFKEEIDAMETKLFVAKEIIKELDKNFSFPKFKTLYKEQAFGKGVEQKVQRTTDLSELLNIYLADPAIPAKTKNLYKIGFNWIFRHTPKISVEKLTPSYYESLAEFIKKGSRERQLKCGVSPEAVKPIERATISSYFRGINGVGGYLLRKGYIESWNNAFASGVINVSKRSEGKAMMDDDLIKFANYCPSDSDKQL